MTANKTIKAAGFKTKRIENAHKGVFGGNCNHVVALVNHDGEVLHFEGKPYYPAGREQAFVALIESGDINSACFSWGHKKEILTADNAHLVATISNINNPEWGTKRFNYNELYLGNGKYVSTWGVGSNSAILCESEYRFWQVESFKE